MTKFSVCHGRDGSPSRPDAAPRRPNLRRFLSCARFRKAQDEFGRTTKFFDPAQAKFSVLHAMSFKDEF
jgi:hypothetical protein